MKREDPCPGENTHDAAVYLAWERRLASYYLTLYWPPPAFIPTPARQRRGECLISCTRYGGMRRFLMWSYRQVWDFRLCIVMMQRKKQDAPPWLSLNDPREDCDRIRAGEEAPSPPRSVQSKTDWRGLTEGVPTGVWVGWKARGVKRKPCRDRRGSRNSPLWAAGRWSLAETAARSPASYAWLVWAHSCQSTHPAPAASLGQSSSATQNNGVKKNKNASVWNTVTLESHDSKNNDIFQIARVSTFWHPRDFGQFCIGSTMVTLISNT